MKKNHILFCLIFLIPLHVTAVASEVKSKEITLLLRYQSYPSYTRIVLEGNEELLKEAKVFRGPEDLQFSIEFKKKNFIINPSDISIKDGLVESIELIEKGDKKVLNILLERSPYDYKSFLLKEPPRRVLDIYKDKGLIAPSSVKATVVIDPGHGGSSLGALGQSGLQEKILTLDIALRLRTYLQRNPDIRVILTRNTDVPISLRERAFIGNTNKADLFISIHGNNSFGKSRKKFAIYLLPPPEPKKKEDRNLYLWDIQYEKAIKDSYLFAGSLKDALKKISGENIMIKEAPLLGLMGVEAPSVFVEIPMGPEEEKNLQKESYKNKIASNLSEGVINHIKKKSEKAHPEGETIW